MNKRWGWMKAILSQKHFKVKLLYFEAGKSISMQRHKYRSELWLFIFGGGYRNIHLHESIIDYKKGDWFWVGSDVWHKFTAKKPTLVLEIQYGDKCSERDIERA